MFLSVTSNTHTHRSHTAAAPPLHQTVGRNPATLAIQSIQSNMDKVVLYLRNVYAQHSVCVCAYCIVLDI